MKRRTLIAILIPAVIIAALILTRLLGPRIHLWMRSREGWPKWRLRVLVVVHRRLKMIFFVVLIWAVVLAMREATWPSRSSTARESNRSALVARTSTGTVSSTCSW